MPEDNKKSIKEVYDAGMAEVFKIVGSLDSTSKQRKQAKQTAEDLSSMLIAHTLETIAGRTALLAGLIVELNQVIESIKTNPPYLEATKNFTTIITKAQNLFSSEKANLT